VRKEDVRKILVAGAGTMGHGIAQSFAQGGYQVSLFSRSQQTLDRAAALVETSLNTLAEGGLLEKDELPAVLNRITFTRSLEEGAGDADIVIESIVEDPDVKKKLFMRLEEICPARALFASNTTFIDIFNLSNTTRPAKLLLCHWYAPPQIIPLVDVVRGPETDQACVDLMVSILKELGKNPIVFNRFVSGYAISRLQMALQREVHFLLDNNYLTPQEIDDAAKWGLALRMLIVGVVQRFDFGGLDLSVKTLEKPAIEPTPIEYKPKRLYELVEQGHLGVKSGRGFYDYQGRPEAEICKERDIKLIRLLKAVKTMGL